MAEQNELPGIMKDSVPTWDEYFMGLAQSASARSPETKESRRVGAVIARDNVVLATGYNGFARGVEEHEWRSEEKLEKLRWVVHAEQNAIFNSARTGVRVEGATLYTTKFPCLSCAKAIVQAGIAKVYTLDNEVYDDELIGDDGRRVIEVFLETNVQLKTPKLKKNFEPVKVRPKREEETGTG